MREKRKTSFSRERIGTVPVKNNRFQKLVCNFYQQNKKIKNICEVTGNLFLIVVEQSA